MIAVKQTVDTVMVCVLVNAIKNAFNIIGKPPVVYRTHKNGRNTNAEPMKQQQCKT